MLQENTQVLQRELRDSKETRERIITPGLTLVFSLEEVVKLGIETPSTPNTTKCD